ncbi:hypothetical protein HELRODRAFT_144645, partial [Helobdella robusta]|uniref:AXH domain-containing protein n=1 Tax=Helobdella robusta TaxID=6412 RepID=T1EJF4_HELRO
MPHYPPHFLNGSIIAVANGTLKKVEDLTTEDFIESANLSHDLKINVSEVVQMVPITERDTVQLSFTVGPQKIQVTVESTLEHPFFVFNRGWSSYNPTQTLIRYKLKCCQLNIGDLCISLT